MRLVILATVVRREALEIVRNRLLVSSIVIPPIVLVALPLVLSAFVGGTSKNLPPEFVAQILASRPPWAGLAPDQLVAAFSLQQFLAVFLIMPAYVPLSIATFSIVCEKQSRSLEAVLATPIRTVELLAGKSIAAVVPGVVTSWLAYGALVGLAGLLLGRELAGVLADGSWLTAVFLLGPAIGLVSCLAGIIVSSRVNDARVAQQIGGVVILPIVGMAGISLAARLFGRETILTRWR